MIIAASLFLLSFTAASITGLRAEPWDIGAVASGGMSFAYGGFFDARDAALEELGGQSLDATGSVSGAVYPSWGAGVFAERYFGRALGMRFELRPTLLGGARAATNDAGQSFDRYSLGCYALLLPIYLRARIPAGSGSMVFGLGPELGLVLGSPTLTETTSAGTSSAAVNQSPLDGGFVGLSGGGGYQWRGGTGSVSVELRADWAVSSASLSWYSGSGAGIVGGSFNPIAVCLAVSYGLGAGGGR